MDFPNDLKHRRRRFNEFIDTINAICKISLWTRNIFDDWPEDLLYTHRCVGVALYNLIFINANHACQKYIINQPDDARSALNTLRHHMAPLTPEHRDNCYQSFVSLKQDYSEPAASYFNRIRETARECYHAGITPSDKDLLTRALLGATRHPAYSAAYQRFQSELDQEKNTMKKNQLSYDSNRTY